MKGFLKGTAIAALVMFLIGVGLTIMGGVMGGGLMNISFHNGRVQVRNVSIGYNGLHFDENYTSEVIYDNSSASADANEEDFMDGKSTQLINEDIFSLDFSLGAAEVFIQPGDSFSFKATNADDYTVRVRNGELEIKLKKNVFNNFFNFNINEKVYITFPKDSEFNEIDIELGAGKLYSEGLRAAEMNIEVGAGQFTGTGFACAGNAEITAGASQVTISGDFKGKTSLKCGAGQITLTLDEKPQNYGYSAQVGLGQAKLFNSSFNGIHDGSSGSGTLPFFELEVGVGQITVK